MTMKQLHDTQLAILKKLLFKKSLHYTELKPEKMMENNKFDWHIKQLLRAELIQKVNDEYSLSAEGKKYVGKFDTDTNRIEIQAKLSVWMVGVRDNANGGIDLLMYHRKKHPFYDCQGFPGGKIKLGETITEAAKREFKEECNLEGTPEVIHLWHYVLYDKEKNIQEDKYMFLCRIKNPTGELTNKNEEGEYYWIPENEVLQWVTKPFGDKNEVKQVIHFVKTIETPIHTLEEKLENENF